jgi:hypothetical protein
VALRKGAEAAQQVGTARANTVSGHGRIRFQPGNTFVAGVPGPA